MDLRSVCPHKVAQVVRDRARQVAWEAAADRREDGGGAEGGLDLLPICKEMAKMEMMIDHRDHKHQNEKNKNNESNEEEEKVTQRTKKNMIKIQQETTK